MRISDWSSDVCSSDLDGGLVADAGAEKLAALREIFHLRHVAADVPARFFLQRARIELQHQPVEPRRGEQMAFDVGGGIVHLADRKAGGGQYLDAPCVDRDPGWLGRPGPGHYVQARRAR